MEMGYSALQLGQKTWMELLPTIHMQGKHKQRCWIVSSTSKDLTVPQPFQCALSLSLLLVVHML